MNDPISLLFFIRSAFSSLSPSLYFSYWYIESTKGLGLRDSFGLFSQCKENSWILLLHVKRQQCWSANGSASSHQWQTCSMQDVVGK